MGARQASRALAWAAASAWTDSQVGRCAQGTLKGRTTTSGKQFMIDSQNATTWAPLVAKGTLVRA
eukprot:15440802-Alexandrium_andersonii.AAC.1